MLLSRSLATTFFIGCSLAIHHDQVPLGTQPGAGFDGKGTVVNSKGRPIHGRFLHITDFHPDPFYKLQSSIDEACHRGKGPAGYYGAEITDCDTPFTLINATFKWINDNVKDSIDFIVWTGDSARHDSDDKIPRSKKQMLSLNEMMMGKFVEVFGNGDEDPINALSIPIVPTFGNNDIMPHNIMEGGPNFWTKKFASIWSKLIPEEQVHSFEHGGWFFVEVIPKRLAVFSLNTLYFFDNNGAVDGCARKTEPGYEHMEWLRIQLQFIRERGMKAILIGHVPPARTDSKQSWDETCWQKYTLWMRQYRDVVIGSIYGHMNIDHFMFQDFKDIKKKTSKGRAVIKDRKSRKSEEKVMIEKKTEYLNDLRDDWSDIPDPLELDLEDPSLSYGYKKEVLSIIGLQPKEVLEKDRAEYFKAIGGTYGESYSMSLVGPSVVPNYFPSMRIIEYNVSGLESSLMSTSGLPHAEPGQIAGTDTEALDTGFADIEDNDRLEIDKKKKKKKKKHHKKTKFVVPDPPSKSAPPGPAYSPQTLSFLGYTQYFANLTKINHYHRKHHEESAKTHFEYEIEYDTRNDTIWKLTDLTVPNYLALARRIGRYQPTSTLSFEEDPKQDEDESDGEEEVDDTQSVETTHKKHKKKKKKHHKKKHRGDKWRRHQKDAREAWFTFLHRAFVGSIDEEDLKDDFE